MAPLILFSYTIGRSNAMIKNHQPYQPINHQSGFTIIELMIATAVFSLMLLVAMVAIIATSRTFVKGNVQSQTQDSARDVLTAITQDIQFNQASTVDLGSYSYVNHKGYFCIGNDVYIYQTNAEINPSSSSPVYHALLEFPGSCPASLSTPPGSTDVGYLSTQAGGGSSSHELLSQDLSLGQLIITQTNDNSYNVSLTVTYGNDVITTTNPDSCPAQSLGGELCAVSTLTTTVTPRIQ